MTSWLEQRHLSTWLILVALIMFAITLRPSFFGLLLYAVASGMVVLARNLGRLERRESRLSTTVALGVFAVVVVLLIFGVRLVVI